HTRFDCDWSSDVCSSDLAAEVSKTPGRGPWVADLVFRYTVGTATYTSSLYSATGEPGFYLRRTAERIVRQHRPGTNALVAYPRRSEERRVGKECRTQESG